MITELELEKQIIRKSRVAEEKVEYIKQGDKVCVRLFAWHSVLN